MKMKIIGIREDNSETVLAIVEDWSLESLVISMETINFDLVRQHFVKIKFERDVKKINKSSEDMEKRLLREYLKLYDSVNNRFTIGEFLTILQRIFGENTLLDKALCLKILEEKHIGEQPK